MRWVNAMNKKYLLIGMFDDVDFVIKSLSEKSDDVQSFYWFDSKELLEILISILPRFEYVIVAIKDDMLSNAIIQHISQVINYEQIIDFYKYYRSLFPLMVCERRMEYEKIKEYEGIILGISHSEVGIIPEGLKYTFANLAVTSQDLYYNLMSFQYCINNYPEKIKKIKYILLDLFDYTYFNYDTSLGRQAEMYYLSGGYNLDGHNFEKNTSYEIDFSTLISLVKNQNSNVHNKAVCDILFKDIKKVDGSLFTSYWGIESRTKTYITDNNRLEKLNNRSVIKTKHEITLRENEQYLYEICRQACNINPNIKIKAFIMPRYIEAFNYCKDELNKWKDYFYGQITRISEEFPIEFFDLSEIELGKHPEYYFDDSHFNYQGAINFTKYINDNILM